MSVYAIYRLYKKIAALVDDAEAEAEASDKMELVKAAFIRNYGDLNLVNQLHFAGRIYFDLFNSNEERKSAEKRLVEIVENMEAHIYGGIFNAYVLL